FFQWDDAFVKGNAAGMAVGQAPYVSKDWGAQYQNDSNWMWEWWYKFQMTDNISITPAIYYISRYQGENSAEFGNGSGTNVNVFGGLLKTTFKF
ncbi:MAG: carbohydrate porin, partial [Cyanobacteria bacterium K_DeepCast_0m_m1_088]|nr:carbohydrate porin [Cyanobacteria bacterium K_DeepCast_0m_m1_088]